MRRRTVLATGAAAGLGFIAGCLGDDDNDVNDEPTPTPEPTPVEPDEPEAGEVTFSVQPSTDEIDWGDEYSVTVTARAGEDPPETLTAILYETEGDAMWSGSFGGTEMRWDLDDGESRTETFEIEPPAVGELTLGLMDPVDERVIDEWGLMVYPPTQSFGETLSYYDGLDMTIDVEFQDWLEFEMSWDDGAETGTYSVRPREGQWVRVWITGENTNVNEEVRMVGADEFTALADRSQLDYPSRVNPTEVGAGTSYEVVDSTRNEEGAWMNRMGEVEGIWSPPRELIPGAVEEGWVLFETDADTTTDDLEIRVNRHDIRATWE